MSKEIIVNGVDVSGCEFRFRTYGCDCMSANRETKVLTESSRCADNPNCHYKQLQREKKKCERLNKQLILFMDGDYCANGCSLKQRFDKLQSDNEELKEQFKLAESLYQACNIKDKKINKLEQAIVEIKDLLLKTPTDSQKHCVNAKGVILSRISEVMPNEN